MPDPFLGEIRMFAGNFAPQGWALCNGQLLQISQNQALFALLGTQYGGDGETSFALPDLRGRVPLGPGQGAGLSNYFVGSRGGLETINTSVSTSLVTSDEPHNHEVAGSSTSVRTDSTTVATVPVPVSATSTTPQQENRQPYLAVSYIIALVGIFPSPN